MPILLRFVSEFLPFPNLTLTQNEIPAGSVVAVLGQHGQSSTMEYWLMVTTDTSLATTGEVCGFWLSSVDGSHESGKLFQIYPPKQIIRVWRRQLLGDVSESVKQDATYNYILTSSCHDTLLKMVKEEEDQGPVQMQPLRFTNELEERDSRQSQMMILKDNLERGKEWCVNVGYN